MRARMARETKQETTRPSKLHRARGAAAISDMTLLLAFTAGAVLAAASAQFLQLDMRVKVKKDDYTVEELGTEVKSQNLRTTQVSLGQLPARRPHCSAAVCAACWRRGGSRFTRRVTTQFFKAAKLPHFAEFTNAA